MWYLDSDRKKRGNNAWGRGSGSSSLSVKMRAAAPRGERTHRYMAIGVLVLFLGGALTVSWLGMRTISAGLFSGNDRFLITADGLDVATTGKLPIPTICSYGGFGVGTNLFALDLEHVRNALLALPLIKSAEVERIPPSTLRVRVEERTPVALIPISRTYRYEVDADGIVIGPGRSTNALPEIIGLTTVDAADILPGFRISGDEFFDALEAAHLSDASVGATMTLIRAEIASRDDLVLTFRDKYNAGLVVVETERMNLANTFQSLPKVLRAYVDRTGRLPQQIDARGRNIVVKR